MKISRAQHLLFIIEDLLGEGVIDDIRGAASGIGKGVSQFVSDPSGEAVKAAHIAKHMDLVNKADKAADIANAAKPGSYTGHYGNDRSIRPWVHTGEYKGPMGGTHKYYIQHGKTAIGN